MSLWDVVRKVLGAQLPEPQIKTLLFDVVEEMARDEGVDIYAIQGTRGTKRICEARAKIAAKLRAEPYGLSLPDIGRALNRHHSSVLWMLRGGRSPKRAR